MIHMLYFTLAEYDNIMKVHQHRLAQPVSQHIIYDRLKNGRSIPEAKAQHCVLTQAKRCSESTDCLLVSSTVINAHICAKNH